MEEIYRQSAAMAEEDVDDATQARLDEFLGILENIQKGPNAEERLDALDATLKSMATAQKLRDGEADEKAAARELAFAFATIEQYSDYLPARFYREFADWANDFLHESNWSTDPDLLRVVGPHIVAASIKNVVSKESY
jgi:hypothetical protein